ncbi:MAG: serine hydrolase, partial [Granulosicoccus sp.]
ALRETTKTPSAALLFLTRIPTLPANSALLRAFWWSLFEAFEGHTTLDLEVFMDALLGGTLVQTATLAQMLEVGSDGYGLGLIEYPREAQQSTFGHGGSIPGYLSLMAMTSDRTSGLIVLTNNDSLNTETVLQNLLAIEFTESSD